MKTTNVFLIFLRLKFEEMWKTVLGIASVIAVIFGGIWLIGAGMTSTSIIVAFIAWYLIFVCGQHSFG